MTGTRQKRLPIFGILLVALCSFSEGVKLAPNGGYDLVLAVKEGSVLDPPAQQRLLQNVKNSLQAFSTQLWRATKQNFFVNSVEIVLPETWEKPDPADVHYATHSFEASDLRISSDITFPHVENPNLCGLPGKFIELPLNFFQNANSNEFGAIWKTLMVLFARFRFGVWEEHGYIGDERFPYFQKNISSSSWEVTGCNDEPLVGSYLNIVDNEECEFDINSPTESLKDCRFFPDRASNTAKTSMMHFHWMDSVVDFCDETTHNKLAENKQNIFCNQRSVMEVIRSSPDFAVVQTPSPQVPAIAFKTTVLPTRPLLYILLDKGRVQGAHEVANLVPRALAEFLQRPALADVIASVGSYPGVNSFITEEVAWSQIGDNLDNFIVAVGDLRIDGPVERDFSRALMEVAETIQEQRPPHGAVVLMVKYGADLDNLTQLLPESEVMVALNEQKVMLFSMELAMTEVAQPRAHLAQVASATEGGYSTLASVGEAPGSMSQLFSAAQRRLADSSYADELPDRRTILKNAISADAYLPIPTGATSMDAFYTTDAVLTVTDFVVRIGNAIVPTRMRRTVDWNEAAGNTKFTYHFRFPQTDLALGSSITIQLNCVGSCPGTLVGRADVDFLDTNTDRVDISISTSANVIDLNNQQPLSIFAKATKNGIPVRGMRAYATITGPTGTSILDLHDDSNLPDVLEGDGVFSAFFAPSTDGGYKMSVTFVKSIVMLKDDEERTIKESSMTRLLPIDQGENGGCDVNTCPTEEVNDNFMQVEIVPAQFVFTNSALFQARPPKVNIYLPTPSTRVLLWRSPRVPGMNTYIKTDFYEIRHASTKEQLINNFEGCDLLETNITASNPNVLEYYGLPVVIQTTYFAVKSIYGTARSDISNIRGFEFPQEDPSTTTVDPTAPTTTVDPTAPTTTVDPTAPTTTVDPTSPTVPTVSTVPTVPTTPTGSPGPTGSTDPTPPAPTTPPNSAITINKPAFQALLTIILAFLFIY